TARLGVSDEKIPTLSDFQASQTRFGQVVAGVSKPLASGGTLSAEIDYNRTNLGFNSPFASNLAKFNPAYRNEINLSYRHPLLRGAGRPEYHEALAAARADIEAAGLQQQVIAQNLCLQALDLHFRLISDDVNIRLAEQTVERARRLLAYQHRREKFGLVEASDRLQAEALLAARQLELEQARARRAANQTALNRLMLRMPDAPLTIALAPEYQNHSAPDFATALEKASKNRPELKALDAQLQAAEARLLQVRDTERVQLDIVAELGTRALDDSAGGAFQRGFSLNDRYAALSLEVSEVVGNNAAKASIRNAELTRQRVMAEKTRMQELIKDDLATAITTIHTTRATLARARKREKAERLKFEAEIQRYREGRSDTATIIQFEGDLRIAALQAELQRIILMQAEKQLVWAQGLLLKQLGISFLSASAKQP
ncbi:MAG: TolC family protein, partial [Mariprofundaceae bacterium]|nr:TolC family protein [Mariprofundaceae bacterium]